MKEAPTRERIADGGGRVSSPTWIQWLKTVTRLDISIRRAIEAAGTTQSDAAPLEAGKHILHEVTVATANQGVVLAVPQIGDIHIVVNRDAQNIRVYPHSGGNFNGQAANLHFTLKGDGLGIAICWATSSTQWNLLYSTPFESGTPSALGTASAGSFPTTSRGDHVHPTTGLALTHGSTLLASVPASASATGVAGKIAADSDYIYICTATNTWKRVAIATW